VKIAVVGVGLIGGSIGLAARSRAGASVCGHDPDPRALAAALDLGAIDRAAEDVSTAVGEAEVVFVAAPVGALPEIVEAVLAAAGPDCVVSDVGSTKQAIADQIDDPRFVGGHPLAGAETAGVDGARVDLFDGAAWYLTPSRDTPSRLLERLRETIGAFGAHPREIDPEAHDRLLASLSHLPHVFANVLVEGAAAALGREGQDVGDGAPAGPSFRDATRVAGANTAIWTDIYLANRDALVVAVDDAIAQLREVRDALATGDAATLAAWNDRARAKRDRLTGADPGS
jgi:prephenate dehydrogenase